MLSKHSVSRITVALFFLLKYQNDFVLSISLDFVDLGGPASLDVFENSVFWTSLQEGSVYRYDKFGRGVKQLLRSGFRRPSGVKTFHPHRYDSEGKVVCLFILFSPCYVLNLRSYVVISKTCK